MIAINPYDLSVRDQLSCDYCGSKIFQGYTRLYTGQIYHHECADLIDNPGDAMELTVTDEQKERVIDVLEEHGPLRVDEIPEYAEMDFVESRVVIHELWDENSVVSGPGFVFEADTELPPNLIEQREQEEPEITNV